MMRRARKSDTPAVKQAVSMASGFELAIAERMRRSERRAWLVAGVAVTMSLVLAGGYFIFLPLKEKVPYLVMADPYTGTATVARLRGDFHRRDITVEEAINKSNVAQFVLARESYDSGLIGQRNWRTTLSMAGPAVAPAYVAVHSEANPSRPYKLYGSGKSVRVRITSIVLLGAGEGRPTGATVRFQRSVYEKDSGRMEPLDSKIATVEFSYNPNLELGDEDRLLNPLGFRVTNYRVDNDFASVPLAVAEFQKETEDPAAKQPPSVSDELLREQASAARALPESAAPGSPEPVAQRPGSGE